ncbi:hypothetical protein CRYUN_Cryun23aG0048100 [Craigia yunnanensis]
MKRLARATPLVLQIRNVSTAARSLPITHQDTVIQITGILSRNNWHLLMDSSDIPTKLKPYVIRSVIHQNQTAADPTRLLEFFLWYQRQIGTTINRT